MIWAIIRTTFEARHRWKDATEPVLFLQNSHRHIFYVELWVEQEQRDRDIEYIQEKDKLNQFINREFEGFDMEHSCEDIAKKIKAYWENMYGNRKIKVKVFEDNENGCLVE